MGAVNRNLLEISIEIRSVKFNCHNSKTTEMLEYKLTIHQIQHVFLGRNVGVTNYKSSCIKKMTDI